MLEALENLYDHKHGYHCNIEAKVDEQGQGGESPFVFDYDEQELGNFQVEGAQSVEGNQADKLQCEEIEYKQAVVTGPVTFVTHVQQDLHPVFFIIPILLVYKHNHCFPAPSRK